MRKKPESKRQVVYLRPETVKEINKIANEKKGSTYGAMQEALERGAELYVAELRGNSSVNGVDIHPTAEVNVEKTTIRDYTSLHVVEAARRVAQTLKTAAAELETALENDVSATATKRDRLGEAVRDANAEADELLRSAPPIPSKSQKYEGKTRRVK